MDQEYASRVAMPKGRDTGNGMEWHGHTDERMQAPYVHLARAPDFLPPHPSAAKELKNSARGAFERLLFFCFARTKLTET